MSTKLEFDQHRPSHAVATAALATVITLFTLWGVVTLFQSRGEPLARVAAAERACAQYAYESDRKACMNHWVAEHGTTRVVRR